MSLELRPERQDDIPAIRRVVSLALGTLEADLVDALRSNGGVLLSLVGVREDDEVIGHILFSPITVGDSPVVGAALAPMCVALAHQRRGIGSQLIALATRLLTNQGYPFVIVLGHPTYYPRFGFQTASRYGISCRWNVPDEAFMVLVLDEQRMDGVSGLAHYRDEFSAF